MPPSAVDPTTTDSNEDDADRERALLDTTTVAANPNVVTNALIGDYQETKMVQHESKTGRSRSRSCGGCRDGSSSRSISGARTVELLPIFRHTQAGLLIGREYGSCPSSHIFGAGRSLHLAGEPRWRERLDAARRSGARAVELEREVRPAPRLEQGQGLGP